MTNTGLDVFDASIQQSNEWLGEIAEELHRDDHRIAYQALRGTLHALRDNLVVDEAVDFAAQLPMVIRGLYYEGWKPPQTPVRDRDRDAFLERVGETLDRSQPQGIYPEPTVQAVFKVFARRVSSGEVNEVKNVLHKDISGLWPTTD